MKEIKIENWKAKLPDGTEQDENLLTAINVLIAVKKPEDIPKGIEKFQIFGKIAEAFDVADDTGTLKMEDREYDFLKETIEKEVPSTWALNKNLNKAITSFLKPKEE